MGSLELAKDSRVWYVLSFHDVKHNLLLIYYFAGLSLHRKLTTALLQETEHEEHFQRFSELQLDDVPDWLAMVTAWEQDRTQPNPYVVVKSG